MRMGSDDRAGGEVKQCLRMLDFSDKRILNSNAAER